MERSGSAAFTLIELLVVIATIGVLAAIAIPQFAEYKRRALNATAMNDLKNSITAEEAYFADNSIYVACADAASCEANLPGFRASRGGGGAFSVSPFSHTLSPTGDSYTAQARHNLGDVTYDYDSVTGVFTQS